MLVSFDIDGTLETGEPPGAVPIALVRRAKGLGYLVGSCSDRPVRHQQGMWERQQVAVDFTVLKHRLADVVADGSSVLTPFVGLPGSRPA